MCFSIEDPGVIIATDNGDQTNLESFQSSERNAFNGLCLAVVRAKPDRTGMIVLKARSEGLDDATINIQTKTAQ